MVEKRIHDGYGRRSAAYARAILIAAVVGATPASAEGLFDFLGGGASTASVRESVERSGYQVRSAIVRRGDIYVCDAVDRTGMRARLVLDAHSGALVRAFVIGRDVAPAPEPRYVTTRERNLETWPAPRNDYVRPRVSDRDWGYAPRPPADVPIYRPYQPYREVYVNVGPVDGVRIPDQVPMPKLVARGPSMSTPSDLPVQTETRPFERPEKPKVRPVKVYAPVIPAPAAPVNSAAVDPGAAATSGSTIVVPATTLPPAPSVAAPAAPPPATVQAQTVANPPAPTVAPPAKKSINDIPVAPLD